MYPVKSRFADSYRILGVYVCAKVFKDAHGVGDHTCKVLKSLVAECSALLPQHGNKKSKATSCLD